MRCKVLAATAAMIAVVAAPIDAHASPLSNGATVYVTGNKETTRWAPVDDASGVSAIDEENQWGMEIKDGSVYSFGENPYGNLGDGTDQSSPFTPVPVQGLHDIVQVEGGDYWGMALDGDGRVWSWGNGNAGELGNGSRQDVMTPERVPGLNDVVQLAGGNNHGMALLADGTVMTWGGATDGELGTGATTDQLTPTPIPGLSGVTTISAGCDWSLALLRDGTVMSWGVNAEGQLGDGTTRDSPVPTAVEGLPAITQISAGGNYPHNGHALAVDASGDVWAWGDDATGQIGIGEGGGPPVLTPVEVPGLTGIVTASAGGIHSTALDAAGDLWVWGADNTGQLGQGSTNLAQPTPSNLHHVTMVWAGAEGTLAVAPSHG